MKPSQSKKPYATKTIKDTLLKTKNNQKKNFLNKENQRICLQNKNPKTSKYMNPKNILKFYLSVNK